MAFKRMTKQPYPPRLWALLGYPGSGKSTFAARMRTPMLPIDADHRFSEVLELAGDDVYALSDNPTDHVSADRIAAILTANMPGSGVRTIVVDSLTAIITPLVVQAMVDKDAGREKNLAAAFRTKALAMRQLQDAVTRWGTDVLWIYHLNDARDEKGREYTRATVSRTEIARLTRSINLQLEIVRGDGRDGDRRGVKVVWARRGRSGVTLWDDSGTWLGMPEAVEAAVYDGLSREDQEQIEHQSPTVFATPELAIAWGFEQGCFRDIAHARNAYDKAKRGGNPRTAEEMAAIWTADVERRLAEMATDDETSSIPAESTRHAGDEPPAQQPEPAPEPEPPAPPPTPAPLEPAQPEPEPEPPTTPPAPESAQPGPADLAPPAAETDDDLNVFFGPPPPTPTPAAKQPERGNGDRRTATPNPKSGEPPARSPQALLVAVNWRIAEPYNSLVDLAATLKQKLGSDWSWPPFKDSAGWLAAFDAAIAARPATAATAELSTFPGE